MRSIRRLIRKQHPVKSVESESPATASCSGLMLFLLFVVVLSAIGPRLVTSISTNTILAVGMIAAALYAYRVFAAPQVNVWWRHRRERRRQQLEQAARYHTDKITRHLDRGEVPHLTDDGEIVFEKTPKLTSESPEEDKVAASSVALEDQSDNQSDNLLDLHRGQHAAQDQTAHVTNHPPE